MRAFDAMVKGERYWINDPELVEIRFKTRDLVDKINQLGPRDESERQELLRQLCGRVGEDVHVEKPIHIDYGCNISFGDHVFINFDWTVLDCCEVKIGSHVFIGPHVSFYTAHHPLDKQERAKHIGFAEPITVEDNVWIGGNCVILPGVTLKEGCVIGAGSVVTKDVPAGTLALGAPCRVIRQATDTKE